MVALWLRRVLAVLMRRRSPSIGTSDGATRASMTFPGWMSIARASCLSWRIGVVRPVLALWTIAARRFCLSLSLSLCHSSCAVACFGVFDFCRVVSRWRLLSCSSASSSGSLFSAATLAIFLRVSWPRWAARGVSSMSSVPSCLARSSLCVCFGAVDEDDRARREDIASRLRIRR